MTDVADAAAEYRRLVAEWGQAGLAGDARRQNKLFDRIGRARTHLAATDDGRRALALLMDDPDPYVRLEAATHSLDWDGPRARSVLEALRDDEPNLVGFTAKMVLRQHETGEGSGT